MRVYFGRHNELLPWSFHAVYLCRALFSIPFNPRQLMQFLCFFLFYSDCNGCRFLIAIRTPKCNECNYARPFMATVCCKVLFLAGKKNGWMKTKEEKRRPTHWHKTIATASSWKKEIFYENSFSKSTEFLHLNRNCHSCFSFCLWQIRTFLLVERCQRLKLTQTNKTKK